MPQAPTLPTRPVRAATPLSSRTAVNAVLLMFAVNGMLLGGYGGSLPSVRDRLDLDATQIAIMLFSGGLAGITTMQIGGRLADKLDDDTGTGKQRFGVFGTTVVAFFLAEMGDKTQIATVALAARYTEVVQVVMGTTVGMMLANVPAVFLGDKIAKKVSMRVVHGVAAAIFAVLGVLTLLNVGSVFG